METYILQTKSHLVDVQKDLVPQQFVASTQRGIVLRTAT